MKLREIINKSSIAITNYHIFVKCLCITIVSACISISEIFDCIFHTFSLSSLIHSHTHTRCMLSMLLVYLYTYIREIPRMWWSRSAEAKFDNVTRGKYIMLNTQKLHFHQRQNGRKIKEREKHVMLNVIYRCRPMMMI